MADSSNNLHQTLKPPEVELTAFCHVGNEAVWQVVAKTERVKKSWDRLVQRHPENMARCYTHLRNNPTKRVTGRIYPLKGKPYKGSWEYEVTSGDRVFYTIYADIQKVSVYYADTHPKGRAPVPN